MSVASILTGWYLGELDGRSWFERLADQASGERAEKWRRLAQVETLVAARLADVLEADGTAPPYPGDSTARSNEHIVALAGQPWGDHMEWLRRIADEALGAMRRDARRLPASHAAIGRLVVEHEAALVAFAEAELAGRPAESLAPIERFLAAHRSAARYPMPGTP